MEPPRLLYLAAQRLDWEAVVPETIAYQLYELARKDHRARFSPVLKDILQWPADIVAQHSPLLPYYETRLADGYTRTILDFINEHRPRTRGGNCCYLATQHIPSWGRVILSLQF